MSNNKLVLKSIHELLEYKFFIPSYQRGYRWNASQVTQLLDDIWEFADKPKKSSEEFYCLQPVVVKATKVNSWEVIDGQQRLTTIRIILSYLVKEHLKRTLKEAYNKDEFTIDYETRPTSEAFLRNLKEDSSNIDFYYMWSAYQTTTNWFKDKNYNHCNKFLSSLLAEEDKENPVKVIWYEINENGDEDAIDIFTRLNIGKIPLTNAELIKALFLGTANPNNQNQKANYKQLQIASEWDAIENTLQDESFWHFIYDKNNSNLPHHKYDTRIEYIFDLMKNNSGGEEKYFTFYKFLNEDFEQKKTSNDEPDIEAIWLSIKEYFLTFQEWYNNRELYHLIGFIITTGGDIQKLKRKASSIGMTKSKFKSYIQNEISNIISVDIEELDYEKGKDKSLIKEILLLTNIQTLLANPHSKSRFPFDSYKKGNWDIEHVRSQSEVELTGKERIDWAKLVLEFYTGIALDKTNNDKYSELIEMLPNSNEISICKELYELVQSGIRDDAFNNLYQRISAVFKEETPPESHNISNLVLLDSGTNRAYKNAFFPLKRMEIMKQDMNGSFVPICTKNVFMKAYSKRFNKIMYWDSTDADDYMNAIKSLLNVYLNNSAE